MERNSRQSTTSTSDDIDEKARTVVSVKFKNKKKTGKKTKLIVFKFLFQQSPKATNVSLSEDLMLSEEDNVSIKKEREKLSSEEDESSSSKDDDSSDHTAEESRVKSKMSSSTQSQQEPVVKKHFDCKTCNRCFYTSFHLKKHNEKCHSVQQLVTIMLSSLYCND